MPSDALTAPSGPGGAAAKARGGERRELIDIFLVSFAGLLLEISYTRVISFKLFYYYTYLIIGLALLGIGAGGVAVALSPRLRRAPTATIIGWATAIGAALVLLGYLVIAKLPMSTLDIWRYGSQRSFSNLARMLIVSLALFAPFLMIGVVISTLFGRRSDRIGRLYFADLVGAALATGLVVFLIRGIYPPAALMLAGVVLALVALGRAAEDRRPKVLVPAVIVLIALVGGTFKANSIDIKVDGGKVFAAPGTTTYRAWSPIFRVDAAPIADQPNEPGRLLLYHDGLLGSGIYHFDGSADGLNKFDFPHDPRAFPFDVLGRQPKELMIIGAAGGHEILASLYYAVGHTDAVELNPVTYDMLKNRFADYAGHIAQRKGVNYVLGDGRSYLERSDKRYDIVWYPAPDSYAAANAASNGAGVLSESYLYTTDAVRASIDHLANGGILATQFGEIDYGRKPNRTARYLSVVRKALRHFGVEDAASHVLVATSPTRLGGSNVSTILVKRTPFTASQITQFRSTTAKVPGAQVRAAPATTGDEGIAWKVLNLRGTALAKFYADYPYDVKAVDDNGPYFWNFARLGSVVKNMNHDITSQDPEAGTGERVLILLLGIAFLFGLLFLIVPFLAIRREWRALPRKPMSALYFSCLGLGFLFFEITLIQRLTLFLGYPTYSLTVTLASVLLFTGVGALLSERVKDRGWTVGLWLLGALAVLTVFYEVALPALTDSLFNLSLLLRIIVTFAVLAPLGLCLGMFMPLGLGAVGRLTNLQREYVAWGWAVNGFASVCGSVLTTLLSMEFGFRTVMAFAVIVYAVAVVALRQLMATETVAGPNADEADPVSRAEALTV
jgi:spermidine synthase